MNLQEEFPLDPELCYLNHAAIGVWPRRTGEAVKSFVDENVRRGAAGFPEWVKIERSLRERFARLVNAPSADDIALLKNTSEALSVIAWGLPWRDGDNVVLGSREFPSNRMVWESLSRIGVEPRIVDIGDADPEQVLIDAVDGDTRLLTVSSVQFDNGLRMDLERLGEHCRRHDVMFCVDAIQSLGALPFDAQAVHADFVVADSHKWMLGPEGVTLFYSRAEIRDRLALHQYGWRMVDDPFRMERQTREPSATARRFEPGSLNTLGIHAQHASLALLQEFGIGNVGRLVLENAGYLVEGLRRLDSVRLLSSERDERRSGIVVFAPTKSDLGDAYKGLMRTGVICARRGGGVRLSPHFYTSREQLDRALDCIRAVTTRSRG